MELMKNTETIKNSGLACFPGDTAIPAYKLSILNGNKWLKKKEDNHTEFLQGRELILLRFLSINQKTYNGQKSGFVCTEQKYY